MLFGRPANSMLLQHSAWGHAASAAPSALERCQRGRSSWESNTSRIQFSHGCSRLWVHLNPPLSSYFLFRGTDLVKLFFSCILLYSAVLMTSLPVGSGIICISSPSLTPWIHEGQHPGQQHGEKPFPMGALGTKKKTQNEISARKEKNCSNLWWHQLPEKEVQCFFLVQQQNSHQLQHCRICPCTLKQIICVWMQTGKTGLQQSNI